MARYKKNSNGARRARDTGMSQETLALPTLSISSWKGGVWKTALATEISVRLAWGGYRVGLVSLDPQMDVLTRWGVSDPEGRRVALNSGELTIIGTRSRHVLNHPEVLRADVLVVDWPPSVEITQWPRVDLLLPLEGSAGASNATPLLGALAPDSRVLAIAVGQWVRDDWDQVVYQLGEVATERGVDLEYLEEPIPPSRPVKTMHDSGGGSAWFLPRRYNTKKLIDAVETMAWWFAEHHNLELGDAPPPPSTTGDLPVPRWE